MLTQEASSEIDMYLPEDASCVSMTKKAKSPTR
jgi:hypothetical protein